MNTQALRNDTIVIRPQKGLADIGLKELWDFRELVLFFVWRDILVRYKQTLIGFLWAVFQPLFAMLIFSIFFGKFAKMPSDNIPYPVFVYAGLIFWNYFAFGLNHASESMVANAGIIQKIYFPRLIIPVSSSLIGLIDFFVAALVLLGLMFYYHFLPSIMIMIYLPVFLLVMFLGSVGLGCFFAAINVKYRDVRYALPFFVQMLMFLTPVIYPLSLVGEKFRWLICLNPVSGVIENARRVIFSQGAVDWRLLFFSLAVSVSLFIFGVAYFRKTEKYFADLI